jgi:hypothetical protein
MTRLIRAFFGVSLIAAGITFSGCATSPEAEKEDEFERPYR